MPQDICAKCLQDVELCLDCGYCEECCDIEEHHKERRMKREYIIAVNHMDRSSFYYLIMSLPRTSMVLPGVVLTGPYWEVVGVYKNHDAAKKAKESADKANG